MKHLRSFLMGVALFVAGAAVATPIGYFGVNGGLVPGPQDPSQLFFYLNTLVSNLNSSFQFTNGEFNPQNANSFSANGTVATTMTSLGPVGSHTTVQEWMIVVDNLGTVRFIPCY